MKTTDMKEEAKTALVPKLRFPEFRKAEGWDADGLGKVADFVNEKIPVERVALEHYVSTENILPDYDGIAKASKLPTTGSVTRYRPNDILVSNIRPYLKKVWIADKEGGASNDVIVIRAKQRLLPQYFSCLLKNDAFIDYVMTGAKGVKMPRGDIGSMKEYPTLYPSLAEQHKIAECLSSLDELIAAQARKVDALKAHKKGLMQQLFPREGETQPRLRFPEFQDAGEWEVKTMGSIASFSSGGTPSKDNPEYWNGTIPWVSASSMYDLVVEKADHYVTPLAIGNGTRIAKKGSILILVRGSMLFKRVPICVAGIDVTFNQDVKALDVDDSINTGFLLYQLSAFQSRIPINETGIGAGKIELDHLKGFELFLPDTPEQHKIAECLSSLDDLIAAETHKIEALKTHKKGLMQQLFPSPEEVEA